MVEVPSAVLQVLDLKEGSVVGISVLGEGLALKAAARRKYTVQELLDRCDFSIAMSEEEREWMDAPAVGLELI